MNRDSIKKPRHKQHHFRDNPLKKDKQTGEMLLLSKDEPCDLFQYYLSWNNLLAHWTSSKNHPHGGTIKSSFIRKMPQVPQ